MSPDVAYLMSFLVLIKTSCGEKLGTKKTVVFLAVAFMGNESPIGQSFQPKP